MRHLVDAHSLIWALDDPAKLGAAAVTALQDPQNELLLSAGTMWEISIKSGLKKLQLSLPPAALDRKGSIVVLFTKTQAALLEGFLRPINTHRSTSE